MILQDKTHDDFSGFRFYTADEIKEDRLPSYEIFRKNIIKYFLVKPGVEQKFYEDLLINTFKIMDEEHISQDPRIAFCMFVLDRPGLFEDVFSNRIDISNLLSQMNMLYLIFST